MPTYILNLRITPCRLSAILARLLLEVAISSMDADCSWVAAETV